MWRGFWRACHCRLIRFVFFYRYFYILKCLIIEYIKDYNTLEGYIIKKEVTRKYLAPLQKINAFLYKVMSLNKKFSKIIAMLTLSVLVLPIVSVNAKASDIGWPVTNASATEEVKEVTSEVAPTEATTVSNQAVESSVSVNNGGVSAIDDSTTTLNNSAIFPEEEYGLHNRLTTGPVSQELSETDKIYSNYSDVVPVVTTDQMVEWILKKGNEIISILQIFAQPFAIIIFIVSCAVCLIGALSKGNMINDPWRTDKLDKRK